MRIKASARIGGAFGSPQTDAGNLAAQHRWPRLTQAPPVSKPGVAMISFFLIAAASITEKSSAVVLQGGILHRSGRATGGCTAAAIQYSSCSLTIFATDRPD